MAAGDKAFIHISYHVMWLLDVTTNLSVDVFVC